jgi:acetyl-CoA synthetase
MLSSGIDWSAPSYEELRRRHRWSIPERFNIARAVCDEQRGVALIEVDGDGTQRIHRFEELSEASARLARGLAALGVEREDRVAVYLPQRVECALAHLASFKLGAISVPLSPLFRADALRHRLQASRAKLVVTDAEHLAALRESSPTATIVRVEEELPRLIAEHSPLQCADTSRDDPAMLCYTSGTTGLPRGALHAHRFLPGRLTGFELIHRLEHGPEKHRPFWTPADWAWIAGLLDSVLTPWAFGCPVVAFRARFDPARALALIRELDVRSLFLPPTALHRMRADPQFSAAGKLNVRSTHTAGEPLPAETYRWASSVLGDVYELYGMTEMGATVGNSPFSPVKPGSMGRPFPGHELALLDDRGSVLAGETEGEIAVRRGDPGMFLGYFEDQRATSERFSGDWMRTGDVARRDADGYLFHLGRNDDVFNTSGYRIGPTEIEDALVRHPAIAEAAVVGEPDEERGHVVKAFLVPRAGVAPSGALASDVQRFVKEHLAAYESPRSVVFVTELPRTETGKIRRSELRARAKSR